MSARPGEEYVVNRAMHLCNPPFLGGKSRKKWRGCRRVQKHVYFRGNTSSPFACSPKALKEMTLSYFFVFLIGSRRPESNYFAQSVGTNEIISFCKVSTATEAPYGREKNLLAVSRNPRGERYSGFQVTGMIEGFFWLSREFLGGKAI